MKIKKGIIFFIILLLIFGFNSCKASSDLALKTLEYDVQLNSDGSAFIKEKWDISIEDTNTLFKTFELDSSKFSGFKNVNVIETTNGIRKSFNQIYKEKYHVDKDCFYGLINSKRKFEIAWGVHEDDSYARRQFEISYTVLDIVKNYSDCSEFYWQFLATNSAIPARQVTGTIKLPSNVEINDDFRVWAHGPLNGNITKISNNTAKFEVKNLKTHTMLEARVVTPTYVFNNNFKNTSNYPKLDNILSQEQEWADEANARREREAKKRKLYTFLTILFFICSNIFGIFIAIILFKKYKKYKEELENAPKFAPEFPSKYYRDIPKDSDIPSLASYLYYFKTSAMSTHISNVFSSIILDLALKKFITFEVLPNNKKQILIKLNDNTDKSTLSNDEINILELFEKVSNTKQFTMKDFEKYCKNHTSSFNSVYNSIEKEGKKLAEQKEFYDSTIIKKSTHYSSNSIGYFIVLVFSIFTMLAAIIPSFLCMIYCSKLYKKYNTLTQKGINEKEKWTGLKNYMNDFSLMKEKEVPELILWEKYLIYATAFGIADKVLKQLKVIYPQLSNDEYLRTNNFTYFYFMTHNNFNTSFVNSISSSISNTYSSINYSSGSGSGGGFSGGGGFGGGGGRNGRKIKKY